MTTEKQPLTSEERKALAFADMRAVMKYGVTALAGFTVGMLLTAQPAVNLDDNAISAINDSHASVTIDASGGTLSEADIPTRDFPATVGGEDGAPSPLDRVDVTKSGGTLDGDNHSSVGEGGDVDSAVPSLEIGQRDSLGGSSDASDTPSLEIGQRDSLRGRVDVTTSGGTLELVARVSIDSSGGTLEIGDAQHSGVGTAVSIGIGEAHYASVDEPTPIPTVVYATNVGATDVAPSAPCSGIGEAYSTDLRNPIAVPTDVYASVINGGDCS